MNTRSTLIIVCLAGAGLAYLYLGGSGPPVAESSEPLAAVSTSDGTTSGTERPALAPIRPGPISPLVQEDLPPPPPEPEDDRVWPVVAEPELPAYIDGMPTPAARGEEPIEPEPAPMSEPEITDTTLVISIDEQASDEEIDALLQRHGLVELRRVGDLRRVGSIDGRSEHLLRDQLSAESLVFVE